MEGLFASLSFTVSGVAPQQPVQGAGRETLPSLPGQPTQEPPPAARSSV